MDVLVSVASKHGATTEIARLIGKILGDRCLDVTVAPPDDVATVEGFDAFVIGSAVYAGRWRKEAKVFVEQHAEELRARPVWLFSSGPLGFPPKPDEDPVDVEAMSALISPRAHGVFAGRLDKKSLGIGERAVVKAVKAPYGDFREWDEIRAWAEAIAAELETSPVAA